MGAREGRARWLVLVVLLLAGAGLAGARWLRPATAAQIRRDPQAFQGRTVTVTGTVTGGAALGGALLGGGKGVFSLDDGTGHLLVTTDGLPPGKGTRVTVRGRVEAVATLALPDAWLRSLGAAAGIPLPGDVTGVVLHATQVWTR